MRRWIVLLFLLTLSNACELDFWMFDSLDHCSEPNETDTVIADGNCNSVGLNSAFPFPGYYRATCDGNGLRFLVSGCRDSNCEDCRRDGFVGSTLYQIANDPIEIQPPYIGFIEPGRNYKCFSLRSTQGVSIFFAAYGTCTQCPVPSPPTFAPVVAPTNFPTRSPVSFPPTKRPTFRPTLNPTREPTPWPTKRPTLPPTKRPTPPPTRFPTRSPTEFPTRTPVESPTTPFPTQPPTRSPVIVVPIAPPSNAPTVRPSFAPISSQPTAAPVKGPPPVQPITVPPSLSPEVPSSQIDPLVPGGGTTSPTESPVSQPTEATANQTEPTDNSNIRVRTVTMQISGTGTLDSNALAAWEKVTADHISQEAGPTEISTAFVTVDDGTMRKIQATALSRNGWDPQQLWDAAFDSPEKRQDYLQKLRDAHPSFASTNSVAVEQRVGISVVGYVLGAVGAAAAIFFICVTLVALRRIRRPKQSKRHKSRSRKEAADREKAVEPPVQYTNDIILLERSPSDGISTLGGYTGIQKENEGDVHSVWDDPTVSVNIGYDFEKNEYKESGPNDKSLASNSIESFDASAMQKLGDTLFSDDKSFEQQYVENRVVPRNPRIEPFEVLVPPGLMGMVVDSAVAGLPPVVRAIRPESVLTDKVRIGDRLLSVDHHDVTKMSARAVSNIISQRANEQRKLVFARVDE